MSKQITELKEKFSNFVKNADDKTRYGIFIGILFFVFLLDYLLIMGPQLGQLTKISAEVKQFNIDLEKTNADIQQFQQYKNQVSQLKKSIVILENKITAKQEVPLILERVSHLADENNIKIDQIKPNPTEQEVLLENNLRRYYSLPILIEAKGDYHDFGKFINRIETDSVYFSVGGFTLMQIKGDLKHRIRLTLKTTVYEDVEEK